MARTILHIDMDAFFAAIEVLDKPFLKGKPVIVGGSSSRGVVSTASYEARRFGVHSAMPLFKAKEKCPYGVFLPIRKERYQEVSRKVMDILRYFTPLVEQVSIDEAYLDITASEALFGSAEEIARQIKARIVEETGLTCSIGVAPNKFLAKVASDMRKPDGLMVISTVEVDGFLSGLPVEKLPGVGERTVAGLRHYGIETAGDLRRLKREQLSKDFGKHGLRLYELARGVDHSPVVPHREVKSVSSEGTLETDTDDLSSIRRLVGSRAHEVAWRLRRKGLRGRTVTLKIKLDDFSEINKSLTVSSSTDNTRIISDCAAQLLSALPLKRRIRLIGVAVSNLEAAKEEPQTCLFLSEDKEERDRKMDEAMDEIRRKFGEKVIRRGET